MLLQELRLLSTNCQQFRRDLELIQRFTDTYSRCFADLIGQLNTSPSTALAERGLRLCIEAVDMMLLTQKQMAAMLGQLTLGQLHRAA